MRFFVLKVKQTSLEQLIFQRPDKRKTSDFSEVCGGRSGVRTLYRHPETLERKEVATASGGVYATVYAKSRKTEESGFSKCLHFIYKNDYNIHR